MAASQPKGAGGLNELQDRIELVDDTLTLNEEFKRNVAIPYFKDIYKDLVAQSDAKSKGINRVSLLTYTQLPGIIGERFFNVLDLNQSSYIDLKEFVHGFFKVYLSNLETKLKLAFDIYDFDKDGYIIKEDVRLILSHIPITNTVNGRVVGEGKFTMMGGGSQVFLDRIQTQEQIHTLIDEVFSSKKRLCFEEFSRIIKEVTSEMFLSIMILLQSQLPCSENFYRYKKNFEKYTGQNSKSQENSPKQSNQIESGEAPKTIASPRLISKLSPINSLATKQGINFQPDSQKVLLKMASQNPKAGDNGQAEGQGSAAGEAENTAEVNVGNFKSAKEAANERKVRAEELEKMKQEGTDVVNEADAIRLPNQKKQAKELTISTDPNSHTQQIIMSPTSFLNGQPASPRLDSFCASDNSSSVQVEGEMIRKATETKLKRYWYCLLGKELYVYKNKQEEKHKSMHSLVGVFVKNEMEEQLDSTTVLHPFKIIFPPNKVRTYYLLSQEDKEKWLNAIKQVIGYSNLFDYYEIKETLGKGKFGLVKSAIHRKTGKKVAVKVMSKKEMSVSDVELQRREIEILKMCQHPHIIRLLDLFENQDYIYIVMEHLSGGDLFSYLEKRKFTISERRAKVISHQIATALYYLHSYGVAHRDLKPENILMATDDDSAELKIVDFGLSKIIGPSETSLDPFGTLSYVAPEVLLQKPYGKEVDLWSLGVITYLLLSRVLPFDDEDDKEIARQTIQDPPDFSFHPWENVSRPAQDVCKVLLEKNRHKRPSLEQVLQLEWFSEFKEIGELRKGAGEQSKFKAYTLTDPESPKIQEEIDRVFKESSQGIKAEEESKKQ